MPKSLLFTIAWFCFAGATAQSFQYRFHSYGDDEGLASESVNAIAEDVHGFIWAATDDGLCRFDAHEFKVFRRLNQNNNITALLPIANGDLWVGTREGLLHFDGKTEKFTDTWKALNIEPAYISRIIPDKKGGLWISSSNGLYCYNPEKGTYTQHKPDPSNPTALPSERLFDILLDSKERLWVSSSRGGLSLFRPETQDFLSFRNDPADPSSISSDILRKLIETPDGKILIGTADRGMNLLDPETFTFKRFNHREGDLQSLSSTSAYSFLYDKQNWLWVGTWSHGLNLFDLDKDYSRRFIHDPNNRYSLPNNSIQCMMQSSTGEIWLGTNNGGLVRLNPEEQKFVRYQHRSGDENSLPTNYITSVYEDEESILWIGTSQQGLHRYDPVTEKFTHYLQPVQGTRDEYARGTIWSISPGEDDILWLGTSRGLARFHKRTGKYIFYEPTIKDPNSLSGNNVLKVLYDKHGNVWAGTWSGGLNRFDVRTEKAEHFIHNDNDSTSLPSNDITDLLIDSKGRLWVASGFSISLFNPEKKNFTNYKHGASMITEAPDGSFWLANSEGLTVFNPDKKTFTVVTVEEGFSITHARSVLSDANGKIWIGHENGITWYNPLTKKSQRYYKADGIAGDDNEPRASFIGKSGKIYFGGSEGLTQINQEDLPLKNNLPRVMLTNLRLLNKLVAVNDSSILKQNLFTLDNLTLHYSDYIFAFEFAALSFSDPQRQQYTYKLEGFDQNWLIAGHKDRKAVYTNVPAGTYTFKVKVRGDETAAETKLMVTVIPPWWKTWWANALFYILVLLIVVSIVQLRFSVVRRQKALLEIQVNERTTEVRKQKEEIEVQAKNLEQVNLQKTKLFSIIAHDLRSPVNSLKGIVQLLDPKILTAEDLEMFRSNIRTQIGTIDTVMSNLLSWAKGQLEGDVTRPEVLDVGNVINELIELFKSHASQKEISLINHVKENTNAWADINQIRAVLRNLISNAIKFTEQGGTIEISAVMNPSEITIRVRDSGIGMTPEQINNLFYIQTNVSTQGTSGEKGVGLGLLLVKEFVEKNGGTIGVESVIGEGSTFLFTIRNHAPEVLAEDEALQTDKLSAG